MAGVGGGVSADQGVIGLLPPVLGDYLLLDPFPGGNAGF